jgi:Cu+-exporting ATPase
MTSALPLPLAAPALSTPAEITVPLDGMHCGACVARAERVLARAAGGGRANLAAGTMTLPAAADAPAVAAALAEAGFAPRVASVTLAVQDMTCVSCATRVETALAAMPGVLGATVNPVLGTAAVRVLSGAATPSALAGAVAAAGYPARALAAADSAPPDPAPALLARARLAGALALPLVIVEMGGHLVPALHHALHAAVGRQGLWLAEMVLAAAVLLGPGGAILARGAAGLWRLAPDMNALVALGSLAAFGYSALATLAPALLPEAARAVYFEAAAVIMALVLFGRWLEARARGETAAAIRRLAALAPSTARILRAGVEVEVPVEQVVPGDDVTLRPGERVPVDGTVTAGESHVDESMLTGEPVPVARRPGDPLAAGTLNGTGALTFRATAVGADTALARIARLVAEAQGARMPVQDRVNRLAGRFVPAMLGVAALTFAAWVLAGAPLSQAMVAAVSVLVVACPCALGLAVPVAVVAATGRLAERGVLVRSGAALQALAGVATVAFDKTGTLTEGRPALTDLAPLPGVEPAGLLRLAAAVETWSEHPLARAVVAGAATRGLALPAAEGFAARVGYGASAQVGGQTVLVGNAALLAAAGVDAGPLAGAALALAAQGRTPVMVAAGGRAQGVLGLADPEKPGAAPAVAALHRLGIGVAMVSGDARGTAGAVAARLGIDRVEAEVTPAGKVAAIAALRQAGPVAFVGDGLNDAPALAAADAGIAIGTGTDVAAAVADLVLMRGDPGAVAVALRAARATQGVIGQNLAWAFAYNLALVPVAAGVLVPFGGPGLSPMLAAAAMSLSSLAVLANALRLRRLI